MKPTTTVAAGAPVTTAAARLHESGDSALLVVADGSTPVALLSATDISRAVAGGRDPSTVCVDQIITGRPPTVDAELPAHEVALTMLSTGVEHLLVERGGRVLGVVHLADVCEWLLALLSESALPREPAVATGIGPMVRHFRLAADLTLERLSQASGVSDRALSDIERGVARGPQHRTVVAIARALHLSGPDRAALLRAARAGRRRGALQEA